MTIIDNLQPINNRTLFFPPPQYLPSFSYLHNIFPVYKYFYFIFISGEIEEGDLFTPQAEPNPGLHRRFVDPQFVNDLHEAGRNKKVFEGQMYVIQDGRNPPKYHIGPFTHVLSEPHRNAIKKSANEDYEIYRPVRQGDSAGPNDYQSQNYDQSPLQNGIFRFSSGYHHQQQQQQQQIKKREESAKMFNKLEKEVVNERDIKTDEKDINRDEMDRRDISKEEETETILMELMQQNRDLINIIYAAQHRSVKVTKFKPTFVAKNSSKIRLNVIFKS